MCRGKSNTAPDFFNPDIQKGRRLVGRAKTIKCRGCRLFDQCEGIWKEYLKRYGDDELNMVI